MQWLLCDYGDVLSLPQDPVVRRRLVEVSGLAPDALAEGYWQHRLAYDRGDLGAARFWQAVLGRPVEGDALAQLVRLDVEGWTRPNRASLAAVARAAERGRSLAILSNAPVEIARVTERLEWLAPFDPQLYSCDLGEVKPHPDIYSRALAALGARGDEVVFVDDKEANVQAAREAGLHAERFTGPEVFEAL